MHRLRLALGALVLFAVSCGGTNTEELLTDLGLSEQEAACLTREYEARSLDVEKLLRANDETDLTDEERSGLVEVAAACSNIGGTATDGDDTPETADGSADDTSSGDNTSGGDDTSVDEATSGDETTVTVDDLTPLEQAFVDAMSGEGLDAAAGICFLTELEAEGFSIFDLASLGMNDEAEPPAGMISAFLRCGDELADAGIADLEGFFSGDMLSDSDNTAAETYGDDPEFDAMWDSCDAGDLAACDELYWLSPIDSEYETYGSTCGLTSAPTRGGCSTDNGVEPAAGGTYGDDPDLDALYDACAAGDMDGCDQLYWDSPLGSEYEAFSLTCGGTLEGFNGGSCADGGEAVSYGDDPDLDADWDACAGGDMAACDALYLWSPFGSDYEMFGSLCGTVSTEELFGGCEDAFG